MNNEIIKRGTLKEKPRIVAFLNENWGDNHPLVNNDVFFDYYYLDGENINFYYLEGNGEIAAICGYIKCSQQPNSDIWVSIWCAKKGKNGLGLSLMGAMQQLTGAKIMSCNNIRENTMAFYTFLGYFPNKMAHYYRLRDLNKYNIPQVALKVILPSQKAENVTLTQFHNITEIENFFSLDASAKPYKDYWYIDKRYFKNPYYSYKVFGIFVKNICTSLVIFRINEGDEGKVLRLVDYIGLPQNFKLLNGFIDEIICRFDCEYCDMYSFGVDGQSAGFSMVNEIDGNIIPNYLNPIMLKNIDYFFFTTDETDFMMFKADGDQDRKNII